MNCGYCRALALETAGSSGLSLQTPEATSTPGRSDLMLRAGMTPKGLSWAIPVRSCWMENPKAMEIFA